MQCISASGIHKGHRLEGCDSKRHTLGCFQRFLFPFPTPQQHTPISYLALWQCFLTLTVAILGPPVNGCSSLPERKLTHSKMHQFSARRVR